MAMAMGSEARVLEQGMTFLGWLVWMLPHAHGI
jgi:hypothetical protein